MLFLTVGGQNLKALGSIQAYIYSYTPTTFSENCSPSSQLERNPNGGTHKRMGANHLLLRYLAETRWPTFVVTGTSLGTSLVTTNTSL
jgi:hypothetical protein